jgi:hypothetical protein
MRIADTHTILLGLLSSTVILETMSSENREGSALAKSKRVSSYRHLLQ